MRKTLNEIQNKPNKQHISSLSREEVEIYFDHRLQNLISDKKVLVRNELEYLLSETGPGNLRIDPGLLHFLIDKQSFIYPDVENLPEIKNLVDQKEKVERYITSDINSDKTQHLLMKILRNYLKKIKIIIDGILNTVPISCLTKNGEWVFPDTQLFSFLKASQEQRKFPIVIAKKICGILFPVFKELSIMGLNTYKIYLSKEGEKLIASIRSDNELLPEIKYNNQFQFIDEKFAKEITDEFYKGEPLKKFFERVLKDNIDSYSRSFLGLKVKIADNFIDTVSQFRKSKTTKSLIANYENKQKLINDLRA